MVNPVRGGHIHFSLYYPVGAPEKPGRGGLIDKPDDSVEDRPEKLQVILCMVRRLVHYGCENLSLFLTADYQDDLPGGLQNGRPQCHQEIGHDRHISGIDQGIIVTDRKFNFRIIN
jgi:hypothetical protein